MDLSKGPVRLGRVLVLDPCKCVPGAQQDTRGIVRRPRKLTVMARMKHRTAARAPAPTIFVLFGATGDLAKRMVIPAFYRLALEGLLPRQWLLIGNGRGDVAHEDFRKHVHDVLTHFGPRPERPAVLVAVMPGRLAVINR
jgi:glucose-6-phosphate dehydrogenase-like protein